MPRYVIRPRADWWDGADCLHLEGKTVYEREPVSTGLVSKEGHPIYRSPEPIGFHTLNERD